MTTAQRDAHSGSVGLGEDFLAIVCEDELLLHAEFDDIVAREFGPEPPADEPQDDAGRTPETPAERPVRSLLPVRGAPGPGVDAWPRQRGPPGLDARGHRQAREFQHTARPRERPHAVDARPARRHRPHRSR